MRRPAVAAVALLAACAAGGLGTWLWKRVEAALARRENEAAVARSFFAHRDAFLQDHRTLSAHPLAWIWSPATGEGRDAASTLNGRIAWSDTPDPARPFGVVRVPGRRLRATEQLRKAVRADSWWSAPEQVPVPEEELVFLDSLGAYDRWELAGGDSPLADWDGELLDAPAPRFEELQAFLLARHAQALLRGDTRSAILTGRGIARLCFSSGHLVGAAIGVSLLGLEARAAGAAVARGQDLSGLEPIDDATIARLYRVVLGGPILLDLAAPPEAEAILPEVRAGRCSAIGEAGHYALQIRPWVAHELEARLRRIRLALDEPGCSLAWVRNGWDRPLDLSLSRALSCASGEGGDAIECGAALLEWTPPYRVIVTDRLLGIPSPDRLRRYRSETLPRRRTGRRRKSSSRELGHGLRP